MERAEVAKQIPILDVATVLGLVVKRDYANCFAGHDDKTPSLHFTPSKNLWFCFGACSRGGSNIELTMAVKKCSRAEAIDWLHAAFLSFGASKIRSRGSPLPPRTEQRLIACATNQTPPSPELLEWFLASHPLSSIGREYLRRRGFTDSTISHFRIGELLSSESALKGIRTQWTSAEIEASGLVAHSKYDQSLRLVWWDRTLLFPVFRNGRVVYLQGRRVADGRPKYVGLRGTKKPLFNLDEAQAQPIGSRVHICEGIPDTLAAHQRGWTAVGVLGASEFRREWADDLKGFSIVVIPHGDQAGAKLTSKIQLAFAQVGRAVTTLRMPEGKDLADLCTG